VRLAQSHSNFITDPFSSITAKDLQTLESKDSLNGTVHSHLNAGAQKAYRRITYCGRLRKMGECAISAPAPATELRWRQTCSTGWWRNIVATLKSVIDDTSELGKEARESVEEFARNAGDRLDAMRTGTGGALHAAASSVRKSSATMDNLATGAADRLDATASYLEGWTVKKALSGVGRFAQNHMSSCLIAAAAVGFYAGSALGGPRRGR
jgi:hypothetical protein